MYRLGDAAGRQAGMRVNVEQASKRPMWTPTRQLSREGRHRFRKTGEAGIGRTMTDQTQRANAVMTTACGYTGDYAIPKSPDIGIRSKYTGALEAAMRYKVALHRTDEGISVSVPALPGCWSEGDTEEEALENIRDAIREYLAALEDRTKNAEIHEVEVQV
jgi:predicted RNase H-like HicB family nuclease